MKIRNKNGTGLHWYFLVIGPLLFFVTYFIYKLAQPTTIGNYIGQYQFSILKAANKAELVQLYIHQSSKYSLQQAIYDLASNGGIIEVVVTEEGVEVKSSEALPNIRNDGCGNLFGYSIWSNLAKDLQGNDLKNDCIDGNKIRLSLEYLFNKNLNDYLLNHPQNLPLDNYEYEINEKDGNIEIKGKAIEPIKFDIIKDESKKIRKEASEAKIETALGLVNSEDFTDTDLCAKGTKCFLTDSAFKKLQEAEAIATKKKVHLKVNSAYRYQKKQAYLWEVTYGNIPEDKRRTFVCYPYGNDVQARCPHLTGNAVDVTFLGKTTKTMTWDEWALLKEIMIQSGWVKYAKEPWHFECCGTNRYELAKKQGVTEIG